MRRGTRSLWRTRHLSCPVLTSGVTLLLAVSAGSVHAQVFETVGARALGMGGAFVAVADDATANYWNPAGLINVVSSAVLEAQRIDTRPGPGQTPGPATKDLSTFVSLASQTLGLSYYRLRSWQVGPAVENGVDGRTTASLTSLATQHAGMTVVQPLGPGVTVATVMKVVHGTVAVASGDGGMPVGALFDQTSELTGRSTTRFDLDVGVMIGVGAVRLALVGRNFREPEFNVPDGDAVILQRQFRAGIAVRANRSLVVAVDADLRATDTVAGPRRAVAVGAEQRLGRVVVRAGGRINAEDDEPEPVASLGLSVEVLSGFWLDGHVTGARDNSERGWGVSTRIGL